MTLVRLLALRAPVSPRPLAVTPERAAWLQRVAFALQVLLAARSGIPSPHGIAPERAASQQRVAFALQVLLGLSCSSPLFRSAPSCRIKFPPPSVPFLRARLRCCVGLHVVLVLLFLLRLLLRWLGWLCLMILLVRSCVGPHVWLPLLLLLLLLLLW